MERLSSNTQQKSTQIQNKNKLLKPKIPVSPFWQQLPTRESLPCRARAEKWQQWDAHQRWWWAAFPLKPFTITLVQSPMGKTEKQDYECGFCTSRFSFHLIFYMNILHFRCLIHVSLSHHFKISMFSELVIQAYLLIKHSCHLKSLLISFGVLTTQNSNKQVKPKFLTALHPVKNTHSLFS